MGQDDAVGGEGGEAGWETADGEDKEMGKASCLTNEHTLILKITGLS